MEYEIEKARPEDLPAILVIYAGARAFMEKTGNPILPGSFWSRIFGRETCMCFLTKGKSTAYLLFSWERTRPTG